MDNDDSKDLQSNCSHSFQCFREALTELVSHTRSAPMLGQLGWSGVTHFAQSEVCIPHSLTGQAKDGNGVKMGLAK